MTTGLVSVTPQVSERVIAQIKKKTSVQKIKTSFADMVLKLKTKIAFTSSISGLMHLFLCASE